jgi:flagella basal body P-ring formation protein FlgA
MTSNKLPFSRHFGAPGRPCPAYIESVKNRLSPPALAALLLAGASVVQAEPLAAPLAADLQRWTQDRADAAGPRANARVQVELGTLDPRLKLAPCDRIEPYLPSGARPWGPTRIGLRCAEGSVRWNVSLPVTVHVYASAPVLREPLAAGTTLRAEHLVEAEVDWADRPAPPLADPVLLEGHVLARALAAGDAVRDSDLQRRQWFGAGDVVRVAAGGAGWRVSVEGQALGRGLDRQSVRVRTEGGRVVTGIAVGERLVELPL